MSRATAAVVATGSGAVALALAAAAGLPASRLLTWAPVDIGLLVWPAAGGLALLLFVLQQQGFVFRWRDTSTKVSLDEAGILLGLLVVPAAHLVLAVASATLLVQVVHRRAAPKAAFNVAQYATATIVAGVAVASLSAAGAPPPWAALAAPPVFASLTALQVSLAFAAKERVSPLRVFAERFGRFVAIGSMLGVSLGLIVLALFTLHPAAVLAVVPVFLYLRRFGRLSEWADDEIATHRLVATVSAEVAGRADLDHVADRILSTCRELFDCGEASLTLARGERSPPRIWHARFGPTEGRGGVAAEILGSDGSRLGSLSVFPQPGQSSYGEREQQLLRTVGAAAAAAAANADALHVAGSANAQLALSEERYRSLFETAHVLIHVLDADGRIIDANPAAQKTLGRDAGELTGMRFQELVSGGAGAALVHQLREQREVFGLEANLRTCAGRDVSALLDGRALAGEPLRYVVFARDITAIKSLDAELRRAMAQQHETIKRLENMNRELEQFTLWTTHDMREPLRSIGTIATFLHDDLGSIPTAEARDLARRICEGSDRLKERVKALHAFSMIVQRDDEFEDVDMQRVVEQAITSLETKVHEKRATIVLPRLPFPTVRAQPHRIDQVFANLIENALKYGRASDAMVEIGFSASDGEWRFFVRDDGPGIPAGYHERIFQLFQRGPQPSEGGSGAGLAIVKRIAEQHGGRAWVESRPGEGACFFVTLPMAAPLVELRKAF